MSDSYVYITASQGHAQKPSTQDDELPGVGRTSDPTGGATCCSPHPKHNAMTDEQILQCLQNVSDRLGSVVRLPIGWLQFARAIEAHHGIISNNEAT